MTLTGTPTGRPLPSIDAQLAPKLVDFHKWLAVALGATDAT